MTVKLADEPNTTRFYDKLAIRLDFTLQTPEDHKTFQAVTLRKDTLENYTGVLQGWIYLNDDLLNTLHSLRIKGQVTAADSAKILDKIETAFPGFLFTLTESQPELKDIVSLLRGSAARVLAQPVTALTAIPQPSTLPTVPAVPAFSSVLRGASSDPRVLAAPAPTGLADDAITGKKRETYVVQPGLH